MSSLGERDLIHHSRTIGRLRVLHLYADHAVFPRLAFTLECTLYQVADMRPSPEPPLVAYELRELTGELRQDEHGPVLGTVTWSGPRTGVRSSAHPSGAQIKLTCDLDRWRLDKVDAIRGAQPPAFWLQVWPLLVRIGELEGQRVDAEVSAIRLNVPRDQWLEFLSRSRADRYEIIEVRFNPEEAEPFTRALTHVRTARAHVDAGDYRAAVGACRLAFDAVLDHHPRLPKGGKPDERAQALWSLAEERAGAGSVDQYRAFFSKMRHLTSATHHDYGATVIFRRSEALFVVRATESLLALLGDLTATE